MQDGTRNHQAGVQLQHSAKLLAKAKMDDAHEPKGQPVPVESGHAADSSEQQLPMDVDGRLNPASAVATASLG